MHHQHQLPESYQYHEMRISYLRRPGKRHLHHPQLPENTSGQDRDDIEITSKNPLIINQSHIKKL